VVLSAVGDELGLGASVQLGGRKKQSGCGWGLCLPANMSEAARYAKQSACASECEAGRYCQQTLRLAKHALTAVR
jgi:hypothetical protein